MVETLSAHEPMEERFAFLPSLQGGEKAVLYGSAPLALIRFLARSYHQVLQFVWSDKLDQYRNEHEVRKLTLGTFAPPDGRADLILAIFPQPWTGAASTWINAIAKSVRPFGQIVILNQIDRPHLPEQAISANHLQLVSEMCATVGVENHLPNDPEAIASLLTQAGFLHPRTKVFTDPDLLFTSEEWLTELDNTGRLIETLASQSNEWNRIRYRWGEISRQATLMALATPPIAVIQAVAPSTLPDSPQKSKPALNSESGLYFSAAELREAPAERLRIHGPDYLRTNELLGVALSGQESTGEFSGEQLGHRILAEYGARALVAEKNPGRLAELLDIPIELAARIVAVVELGRRFFEEPNSRNPFIRGPEDAHRYLADMSVLKKEHLRGLYLNVQSRLIHDEVISIGTLSRSVVHPREVFAPALEHAANALILAHNHPSGDLTPSEQDIAVTRQVVEAGRIMGIEVVDHIIISSSGYISLKKERVF